jgi:drug/metabolite transporter (DMT)-like permease
LTQEKHANSSNPGPLAIWGAMITVYIVWGSTYLAIKFAIDTMPPFLMAGVRFIIAGAVLYIWRRLAGDTPPRRIEWRSAAIVGLFLLLGGNGGVVWAEQFVPSGITALLVGSAPLWMVLLDALLSRRGVGPRRPKGITIAGVVLGFAGIALLAGPSQWVGVQSAVDPVGAIVLTLAAFLWASGSIFSRGAPLPASPLLGTGMEMLVGGLGLLAFGTVIGEWGRLDLANISTQSFLAFGYLVVFGSLVGFTAYTWLLRVAPTPLVSTYAYVNPLVAIFLGLVLAREPLSLRMIISAAVILSAVALITATQPVKRKAQQPGTAPATAGDD